MTPTPDGGLGAARWGLGALLLAALPVLLSASPRDLTLIVAGVVSAGILALMVRLTLNLHDPTLRLLNLSLTALVTLILLVVWKVLLGAPPA